MDMQGTFGQIIEAVFSQWLVRAVLGLLVTNFISGSAVAIKDGTWRAGAIMDWLAPTVYLLLGGLLVQLLLWSVPPEYVAIGDGGAKVVWAGIIVALVGKVLQNVAHLGVPIPIVLTDKEKPAVSARP